MKPIDISIVGFVKKADGIGQHAICCIEVLKGKLNTKDISFISTNNSDFSGLPGYIVDLVESGQGLKHVGKYNLGKFCFFTDLLWFHKKCDVIHNKRKDNVWVAYSVVEGSRVYSQWVQRLNQFFDAVCVPDQYLVQVYKSSGVKIPIFVLPLTFNFSNYLAEQPKKHSKFTFGFSSEFCERKNHIALLKAFISKFKNNPEVYLKMHGRGGDKFTELVNLVNSEGASNVELINKKLTNEEYFDFMCSLSCYVNPSKGEGFSISVREAMALGLPCIITNNTAHTTICNSGLVLPIECPVEDHAYYQAGRFVCGKNFNFNQQDMEDALQDMYENYDKHFLGVNLRKEWVINNNTLSALQDNYYCLFKPLAVKLGPENKLTKDILVTNSVELYKKYLKVLGCKEA